MSTSDHLETVEHHVLYEDSNMAWAVRVEDEDDNGVFQPVDLTGATITADVDNQKGVKITEWAVTIPTQTGDDLGWVELDLPGPARTLILGSGKDVVEYDVRVVTAAGETFYPITRSSITVVRAVTGAS